MGKGCPPHCKNHGFCIFSFWAEILIPKVRKIDPKQGSQKGNFGAHLNIKAKNAENAVKTKGKMNFWPQTQPPLTPQAKNVKKCKNVNSTKIIEKYSKKIRFLVTSSPHSKKKMCQNHCKNKGKLDLGSNPSPHTTQEKTLSVQKTL